MDTPVCPKAAADIPDTIISVRLEEEISDTEMNDSLCKNYNKESVNNPCVNTLAIAIEGDSDTRDITPDNLQKTETKTLTVDAVSPMQENLEPVPSHPIDAMDVS